MVRVFVLERTAKRLTRDRLPLPPSFSPPPARFCIRTFKDVQLGKPTANIKQQIGPDLQALTEANVYVGAGRGGRP